jgi:hypothetical protein
MYALFGSHRRIYFFSSISLIHSFRSTFSLGVVGYILQLSESGEPGFRLIAWSQVCDGGNRWDSSSLKTCACHRYSGGISTLFVYCPASTANFVDMLRIAVSVSNSSTITSFSWSVMIPAMVGRMRACFQSRDLMTIGRVVVSITASLQLNFGSKVASQGYPRTRSSLPKSVMRNRICASRFPVRTSRSTKWVSSPPRLLVPLIFHIFRGRSKVCFPRPRHFMSFRWMKLSVAPESTRIHLSAIACSVLNETGTLIDR